MKIVKNSRVKRKIFVLVKTSKATRSYSTPKSNPKTTLLSSHIRMIHGALSTRSTQHQHDPITHYRLLKFQKSNPTHTFPPPSLQRTDHWSRERQTHESLLYLSEEKGRRLSRINLSADRTIHPHPPG